MRLSAPSVSLESIKNKKKIRNENGIGSVLSTTFKDIFHCFQILSSLPYKLRSNVQHSCHIFSIFDIQFDLLLFDSPHHLPNIPKLHTTSQMVYGGGNCN